MCFCFPGVNRVGTHMYWSFAMLYGFDNLQSGSSRVLFWQSKPRAAVATCVNGIFWGTCPPTPKIQCIGPLKIVCRKRFSGAFWTNNRAWQRFRRPQICRNWPKKNKTPYWGQILAGLQFLCGGLEKSCSLILANRFTHPSIQSKTLTKGNNRLRPTWENQSNDDVDNVDNYPWLWWSQLFRRAHTTIGTRTLPINWSCWEGCNKFIFATKVNRVEFNSCRINLGNNRQNDQHDGETWHGS